MSENLLNNNALATLAQRAAPQVLSAIKHASVKTGVNFAYLMEQAAAESNFDADAKASTSSATGLYQFIESTWMNMVKKHGAKHGLGDMADQIDARGKVADREIKDQILDLRNDPEVASLLAAEFAAENMDYLERHYAGDIGSTELYFAHFMGAGGAAGFLNAMKDNPLQNAADLFPKAARANRNVFYDRQTGEPRTLAGVYEFFEKKFQASDNADLNIAAKAPPRKPSAISAYGFKRALPELTSPLRLDNTVSKFINHPLLNALNGEDYAGWRALPMGTPSSLMMNPVELMMMASLDTPFGK